MKVLFALSSMLFAGFAFAGNASDATTTNTEPKAKVLVQWFYYIDCLAPESDPDFDAVLAGATEWQICEQADKEICYTASMSIDSYDVETCEALNWGNRSEPKVAAYFWTYE